MAPVERLFGWQHAFDSPVVAGLCAGVGAVLLVASLIIFIGGKAKWFSEKLHADLSARTRSWWWLAPLMVAPVLAGAFWVILGTGILALLCYREFARATGLFRQRAVSVTVAALIALVFWVAGDHWYNFFLALPALGTVLLVVAGLWGDQPAGYIQRTALGIFAFLLFGIGLGHLAWFANDPDFRPMLLMLLAAVELNDVFAYCCGKAFGRRKLCPGTSPNKTLGGALGALALTTLLVAGLGHFIFAGTVMGDLAHLLPLGVLVALAGQLGDLVLSAIKRDLGMKDIGAAIPGHGGLLDRFDSILLVAPAAFHYIGFFNGVGKDEPARLMSSVFGM